MSDSSMVSIEDVLKTLPLIKENGFLKAYTAHKYLQKRLTGLDAKVFEKAWSRLSLSDYPKTTVSYSDKVTVPAVIPEREKRILERRIFPVIYGIVNNKVRDAGAKRLMQGYLQRAIQDPEYHGIRLSLLTSFWEVWNEIEGQEKLEAFWKDRFAEHLAMSFYSERSDYSLLGYDSPNHVDLNDVLLRVAKHPGYEGHHLIFLSAIEELKTQLLKEQRAELIYKAKAMTELIYADLGDNVKIQLPSSDDPTSENLEIKIRALITQGPDVPQTLIVARAICHLWDIAEDEVKLWLLACAERFMRRD